MADEERILDETAERDMSDETAAPSEQSALSEREIREEQPPEGRSTSPLETRARAIASRPFRLWDIAIYATLLLLIAAVMLAVFLPRRALGRDAVLDVYLDNELTSTYRIDEEGEYEIKRDGEVLAILRIEDGEAVLHDSTCADKLCEHMRIKRTSDQIICLPNRVSIVVHRDSLDPDDIVPGGAV